MRERIKMIIDNKKAVTIIVAILIFIILLLVFQLLFKKEDVISKHDLTYDYISNDKDSDSQDKAKYFVFAFDYDLSKMYDLRIKVYEKGNVLSEEKIILDNEGTFYYKIFVGKKRVSYYRYIAKGKERKVDMENDTDLKFIPFKHTRFIKDNNSYNPLVYSSELNSEKLVIKDYESHFLAGFYPNTCKQSTKPINNNSTSTNNCNTGIEFFIKKLD